MQNPSVRDVKIQVGEPRIVAVCHRESYNQPRFFSLSTHQETSQSPTSVIQHDTFCRVHKFPTFLNLRSSVSVSTFAAEDVNRVEHHHVRSLRLLQTLMAPDLIEQFGRRERCNVRGVR